MDVILADSAKLFATWDLDKNISIEILFESYMTNVLSKILNKLIDWQLCTWLGNWSHRTVAYGTRVAMRANLGRCDTGLQSDAEGCRRQFYSYLWSVSVIPPQSWWTIAAVASRWDHWDKKVWIMALFGTLIMTVNGRRPTTATAIVNATTTTLHGQFIRTHACTGDKPRQSVPKRNNTKEPG